MESSFEMVREARYLIVLQLFTRIAGFVVNAAVLRKNHPLLLGLIGMRFDLVYGGIIFIAREAVRSTIGRNQTSFSGWNNRRSLMVFSCFSLVIALIIGIPIGLVLDRHPPFPALDGYSYSTCVISAAPSDGPVVRNANSCISQYSIALLLYGIALIVELITEPLYNAVFNYKATNAENNELATKTRTMIELLCFCAKSAVIFLFVELSNNWILIGFGCGQLVNSVILLCSFYYQYQLMMKNSTVPYLCGEFQGSKNQSFLRNSIINARVLGEFWGYWKYFLVKLILAQGDLICGALFLPMKDQGILSVVTNYGSLPIRMLFGPMEEVCKTRTIATIGRQVDATPCDEEGKIKNECGYNQISLQSQLQSHTDSCNPAGFPINNTTIISSGNYLMRGLKFEAVILYYLIFIGTAYTQSLLWLFVGKEWAIDAGKMLSCYLMFLLFAAFNGMLEVFAFSTLNQRDLRRNQQWLSGFCVVFLLLAYVMVRLIGGIGLILANIMNMIARILLSLKLISSFEKRVECTVFSISYLIEQDKLLVVDFLRCYVVSMTSYFLYGRRLEWSFQSIHLLVGIVCTLYMVPKW